ncbi:MAG: hypothetical protein ACO1SV_01450 [Fimbriimonas sp.]
MVLYQSIFAAMAMGVGAQDALPNPFRLEWDQVLQGNPLAQYAELRKREADYLKGVSLVEAFRGMLTSPSGLQARMYAECRATIEGNLGRIQDSLRTQEIGDYVTPVERPFVATPLQGMRRRNAVDFLVEGADRHAWLMCGEEHMKPQSRTILLPLLRGLRRKGFRYFAAETFGSGIARASRKGYVEWNEGIYTQDPVFGQAVREAIRLGFTLVPYDDTPMPKEVPPNQPMFTVNFRENAQAMRLKERILDRDPKAKVLVWGGRGHVSEEPGKFPDGSEIRPMASEFRRLTGIDPLTAYLPRMMESATATNEPSVYKDAVQRGWIGEPTVFVGKTPYTGGSSDVAIFFPRTRYVQGRPDWLRPLDRMPVPIPPELARGRGMLLAQAWPTGEPETAVPIDQILLMPGDPLPALMLPRKGTFRVRVIDASGKPLGQRELRTS